MCHIANNVRIRRFVQLLPILHINMAFRVFKQKMIKKNEKKTVSLNYCCFYYDRHNPTSKILTYGSSDIMIVTKKQDFVTYKNV